MLQALKVLDQPINDETEDDGEKKKSLVACIFDNYCRWFCKTTNEAIFQGSVSDTVRNTILHADCPRSRVS